MAWLLQDDHRDSSPTPEWPSSTPFGMIPVTAAPPPTVRLSVANSTDLAMRFLSAMTRPRGNAAPQVSPSQRDCRLRRLHRDLKEIREEPLHGIQVVASDEEDEDGVAHLCLILRPTEGCFAGLVLHLTVTIPPRYPSSAPLVTIQTRLNHPNVMPGQARICCHLLESSWTPAYVLKYFLLQLLVLFSQPQSASARGFESILHQYSTAQRIVRVRSYSCGKCGFKEMDQVTVIGGATGCGSSSPAIESKAASPKAAADHHKVPSPGVHLHLLSAETGKATIIAGATGCSSSTSAIESKAASTSGDTEVISDHRKGEAPSSGVHLHLLPADAWLTIIALLSEPETVSLCIAFPNAVGRIAQENGIVLPDAQIACCFYLRRTFQESVLGLGIVIEQDRWFCIKALDFLSEEAFSKHKVRQGVWGGKIQHFLPLALNPDHFCRALPFVLCNLTAMHNSKVGRRVSVFQSMSSFGTIPRLMNQMILDLGKVCHHSTGPVMGGAVLQASEKALQGYCLLLHLLTMLSNQFPQLREEARRKLDGFMQDPSQRRKNITPNLGEFLAFLPLVIDSDEKARDLWPALCSGVLEELLQRKATGYLKQTQYLANLQAKNYKSVFRILRQTFERSKMALRALMFQARFMKLAVKEREELARRYGYPTKKMSEYAFHLTREIYSGSGWEHLFKVLRSEEEQQIKTSVEGLGWASEVVAMLSRCSVEVLGRGARLKARENATNPRVAAPSEG